jgi:hypothetical protein
MDNQGTYREGAGSMNAPRFSLKLLLVSIALIAIGLALERWLWTGAKELGILGWPMAGKVFSALLLISGTMIVAGLLIPFRPPLWAVLFFGMVGGGLLSFVLAMFAALDWR